MKATEALNSLSKQVSELQAKEARICKENIGKQSLLSTTISNGKREAYIEVQSIILETLQSLPLGD
jgi:hypothetical protein